MQIDNQQHQPWANTSHSSFPVHHDHDLCDHTSVGEQHTHCCGQGVIGAQNCQAAPELYSVIMSHALCYCHRIQSPACHATMQRHPYSALLLSCLPALSAAERIVSCNHAAASILSTAVVLSTCPLCRREDRSASGWQTGSHMFVGCLGMPINTWGPTA